MIETSHFGSQLKAQVAHRRTVPQNGSLSDANLSLCVTSVASFPKLGNPVPVKSSYRNVAFRFPKYSSDSRSRGRYGAFQITFLALSKSAREAAEVL